APTDPTYRAIAGALRLQNEIEAQAIVTLDDSRLTEVLADDPRGGLYGDDSNAFYLQTVRWYTGNPQLQGWQVGALSARQAYYGYLRAVRDLYNEALASGAIKGQTQFAQLPAAQALMQASGFGASTLPSQLPTHVAPVPDYPIESISVAGDLAYMRVTFPCAK